MKSSGTASETLDGKPEVTAGTARRRQINSAAIRTADAHERAMDFRTAGEVLRPFDAANLQMLRHSGGFALAYQGCELRLIDDYPSHRDPEPTVRDTRSAGKRFEGLWSR